MQLRALTFAISAVVAVLCAPAAASAQKTIDLEKIRQEHDADRKEASADREQAAGSDDEQDDGQDEEGGSGIRIESAGGSSTSSFGGQITLSFDKRGHAMLVPAKVGGKSVYFVFDTGATYTTLTPRFAASIGARPGEDAPATVSRTANGQRAFRFGIMSSLTLAGRAHNSVTFGACAACGGIVYRGKPVVGLLGLNVLRRYRINVDHSAGEVRLEPGPEFGNRSKDIAPWLEVSRHTPPELDVGDFETAFSVENKSPRDVTLALRIDCRFRDGESETINTGPSTIRAGQTSILRARSGRKFCRVQDVQIEDASW